MRKEDRGVKKQREVLEEASNDRMIDRMMNRGVGSRESTTRNMGKDNTQSVP